MLAKTIVFTAPKTVALEEVSCRDEDLLTSRLMGISAGTERHILLGHMEGLTADPVQDCSLENFSFPLRYGYINIAEDQRKNRYFAFFPHQTHFCKSEALHLPIPEDISDEDAVFLANTETAVSIAHDVHLRLGENILIIGAGVIGLLLAEILILNGAGNVFVAELNPYKKHLVESTGALFIDASQDGWHQNLLDQGGHPGGYRCQHLCFQRPFGEADETTPQRRHNSRSQLVRQPGRQTAPWWGLSPETVKARCFPGELPPQRPGGPMDQRTAVRFGLGHNPENSAQPLYHPPFSSGESPRSL
jgi:hypothetical protein